MAAARVVSVTPDQDRYLRHLRAMAADVARLNLFEELRIEGGPLSTAELGRRVPESRGGIQAHLSALADGEWIEHVSGVGKQATWQAKAEQVEWADVDAGIPELVRAQEDLYWITLQRRINRIRRFDAERQTGQWDEQWVAASIGRDYSLWLTATDVDELDGDLVALMERYRERSQRRRAERTEGAQVVFVTASAVPLDRESTHPD